MITVKTIETQNNMDKALQIQDVRTQEHCNSLATNMQNQIEESSKFTISSLSSSSETNNNMLKEIIANATASTHAIVTQAFGMLIDTGSTNYYS